MSIWSKLFGTQSSKTRQTAAAKPAPVAPRPSPQLHATPPQPKDNVGFFVFDYEGMDSYYGKQAFDAIYKSLRPSSGICAFHDGDIFNCETVRELAKQANLVTPAGQQSPLADLNVAFRFGAYFAAMWTDTYPNFRKLHDSLCSQALPGYLGYMVMRGRAEIGDAVQLFSKLSLPAAIALKNGEIIKGWSKYGIGFRSVDRDLLRAAQCGEIEAARKAVAEGADVDCIDPEDRASTPILYAACEGYSEIVRFLLEKKADPNASNLGSNTGLMLAARRGHMDAVKALIAGGAKVNARDSSGGTALDNAREHPEIAAVLRQAGAVGR